MARAHVYTKSPGREQRCGNLNEKGPGRERKFHGPGAWPAGGPAVLSVVLMQHSSAHFAVSFNSGTMMEN